VGTCLPGRPGRPRRPGHPGWTTADDPSQFCLFVFAALSVASTRFGIGQHINTIPFERRVDGLKLLYIGRFFGLIALAVSKTSFAITLLNLAMMRWQKISIWFIMVTINLTLGLTAFTLLVQCNPIEKAWDLAAPGTCWPSNVQITIGIAASGKSPRVSLAAQPADGAQPTPREWTLRLPCFRRS